MSKRSLPAASIGLIAAPWASSAIAMVGASAGPGVATAVGAGATLLVARGAIRRRNSTSGTSVQRAAKAARKRGTSTIPSTARSARSLAGGRKRSTAASMPGPGRAGRKTTAGARSRAAGAGTGRAGTATTARTTTTATRHGAAPDRVKTARRPGGAGRNAGHRRATAAQLATTSSNKRRRRGGLFAGGSSKRGTKSAAGVKSPRARTSAASLGPGGGRGRPGSRKWWNPRTWRKGLGSLLGGKPTSRAMRERTAAGRVARERYNETRRRTEGLLRRPRKNAAWSATRRIGNRLRRWQPRGAIGRVAKGATLATNYIIGAIASSPKALYNTASRLGARITRAYQLGQAWAATWTGVPLTAALLNQVELASEVRDTAAPRIRNVTALNRGRPVTSEEVSDVQTNMAMLRELIEGLPAQQDFSGVAVERYMLDTVDALSALQTRMGSDLQNIGEKLEHLDGGEGLNQLFEMLVQMITVAGDVVDNWRTIHAEKLEAQRNPTEASKNWESSAALDY